MGRPVLLKDGPGSGHVTTEDRRRAVDGGSRERGRQRKGEGRERGKTRVRMWTLQLQLVKEHILEQPQKHYGSHNHVPGHKNPDMNHYGHGCTIDPVPGKNEHTANGPYAKLVLI